MRIFVIGEARSGKSTAARFLAESMGYECAETSELLIRELAKLYSAANGYVGGVETWAKLIAMGKSEFRKELACIGDLCVSFSKTYLIDECLKRAQIVVGVRRRSEVLGYFQNHGRQSWKSVWIKVVGPESGVTSSNYELQGQPCDYLVTNSGDLNELKHKMFALARVLQAKSAA